MTVHLQCILPCKYKCENHLCCYNSNWHGKHGCQRYTHWHLRTKMNAKTLLDRDKHQISEFLKREFCFICGKLRSDISKVLCNDYTLAWVSVPSVSFLTGADVGAVSQWYNSQSRHKHGLYWGTHQYLVLQKIFIENLSICGKLRSGICKVFCNDYTLAWVSVPSASFLYRKSVYMVFTHELVVSEIEGVSARNE